MKLNIEHIGTSRCPSSSRFLSGVREVFKLSSLSKDRQRGCTFPSEILQFLFLPVCGTILFNLDDGQSFQTPVPHARYLNLYI